jgi:glycosyltransferase involved in cell wall biosynthesis
MIYISLPISSQIGWGICGRYISQELSRLADVRLVTNELSENNVRDELDFRALSELLPSPAEVARLQALGTSGLDGPLLTACVGYDLKPVVADLRGTRTVGYTFFESNYISDEARESARQTFDHLVAGSTACEERLRAGGLTNVSTIIQGIDPALFNPAEVERRYLRGRFVVFSGGKLEHRKGQDVVVRAFKVLHDKYSDAVLMTAWNNPFMPSRDSMRGSHLVRFAPRSTDPTQVVREFLADNGIDPRRCVVLGPKPNFVMSRFYKQTDVGLFPNRCEGGTNLVLMEYMACGKPAIATHSSGHRDVVTPENAIVLNDLRPVRIEENGRHIATWDEPNVDEAVAALEFAYQNRERTAQIAGRGGADMQRCTWQATARQFLECLVR